MAKILIIEDDANLALMLESFLLSQHYAVDIVSEGSEGLHQALYYPYDLIILDLGLPNTGGLEICREYRKSGGAAGIIMLTGKSHIKDKKAGLDTGADDYLTKPFEMEELAARVRALLRRPRDIKPDILTVRNISLNPASGRVTKDGAEVRLIPTEFALLEFLMRHPNQSFTAKVLVERIWSSESETSPENIKSYMSRLRGKLKSADGDEIIRTIRGRGYMIANDE